MARSWVKSGRCSGRGCGWGLRERSWRRDGAATGAWADGGSAVQRRRGGAGSSAPAERVKAAARVEGRRRVGGWVQGSREGANKGQAGDLGDACLAEPRRRSRRFPLSARGMREEEGDPDQRARGRSETGQAGEAVRPLRPGGAEGERACAGWAVRSWAKPEVVGRARKWSRGTGLGPREEEEGREREEWAWAVELGWWVLGPG